MTDRLRTLLAFAIAPGVPAAAIAGANLFGRGEVLHWTFALVVAVMSYLVALVLGLPCYLIMRKYAVRSVGVYLVCGALLGIVGYGLFFLPQVLSANAPLGVMVAAVLEGSARAAVVGVASGTFSALVFWAIAGRRSRSE